LIGESLSHYRIVEKIGEGGMGVVYRARDTHLDRDVALKVLPDGSLTDRDARARLRQEAMALSKFNHPNIETVYDFDTENGIDFLVVEYLEGATLDQKLGEGPLGFKETLSLGQQLAAGLGAAHEQSVIHRDLKPANLLVMRDGRLKILDFGLAKHLQSTGMSDSAATLLVTRHAVGTPAYMAPEQLRGESVDGRTDVFGMGCVLYEFTTGKRAFEGRTGPELSDAILHQPPVVPRAVRAEIHPELERIILKCLEKDCDSRYQSTAEIEVDLRRLEQSELGAGRARLPSQPQRKWVWPAAAMFVLLLGAGLYGLPKLWGPPAAEDNGRQMLAVLPFEDLSSDQDQEYFGDGITEEMLAQLGRLQPERLGVIARTSVMRYKGTQKSIGVIGDELGVDYIIEGSVRREQNRVRVTAQLIQVSDETHVWANSYDGELREILSLQSEMARAIASEIRLTLSARQQQALGAPREVNQEAFEAYLKGRYWWNRRGVAEMQRGIEYFRESIEADPLYAPAYAGLGNSYLMLGSYDALPPHDAFPKAQAAATEALELDETLAEAHACLAYVSLLYEWDWEAAEAGYLKALSLDPNYALGHMWYAIFRSSMGRESESVAAADRALALDPLSLIVGALRGWVLYLNGEDELAVEQCQETLQLDPSFYPAHMFAARAYVHAGRCEDALNSFEESLRNSNDEPSMLPEFAFYLARCGQRDRALEIMEEIQRDRADDYFLPINLALIHSGLGNVDEALTLLEQAVEERYPWVVQLQVDPWWDALRGDPRFAALESRIGFDQR
jgi:serine/threonine-protein kinase